MEIQKELVNDILLTISEYRLIDNGDSLLLMCSGGPDSTFLLLFFNDIKNLYSIKFGVFHLDHKIRWDSYREKELLEFYCKEMGIEFFNFERNILDLSKKEKRNLEEFARSLRYDLAYDVAKKYGFNKIVTAHNLDDLFSSFFINLLKKRHYVNLFNLKPLIFWKDIKVIRPLIFIPKAKILAALRKNRKEYITDYTNFDQSFLRNSVNQRVTRYVVSYFKNNDNINIWRNIFRFSDLYVNFIKSLVDLEYLGQKLYRLSFKIDSFKGKCNDFIISESLYFNIRDILDGGLNYSSVEQVLKNKLVTIKKNWNLQNIGNDFYLFYFPYKFHERKIDFMQNSEQNVFVDDLLISLKVIKIFDEFDQHAFHSLEKIFSEDKVYEIKQKKGYYLGLFGRSLLIRLRRDGDFFYPYGLKGKKQKIKKFFIDKKLENFEKDRCLIFEDEHGIALIWCYQKNLKRGRDLSVLHKKRGKLFLVEINVSNYGTSA